MPRVTGVRELPRSRVAVDLDGSPWRTLPLAAVVRAGLADGVELDRERARVLRRELRRAEALAKAARTLAYRDESTRGLDERLRRRGVAPAARRQALETMQGLGVLDDRRFANQEARRLAERAYGNAAIAFRLERSGLARGAIDDAIGSLTPERTRAEAVVARRGATGATARYLARRGFSDEAIEDACGPRLHADGGEV